jgi:hypothetical protein
MNEMILTLFVMLLFLVGVATDEASGHRRDVGYPITS